MYNLITPKTHEQWLELKAKMITGTDVSAIYGLDGRKSDREVYERIVNGLDVPFIENDYIRAGKILEKYVFDRVVKSSNSFGEYYHNTDNKLVVSEQYPHLGGTPDGFFTDLETKEQYILEIKTTSLNGLAYDNMREKALYQSGYYASICGYNGVILIVLQLGYGFNYKGLLDHYDTHGNIDGLTDTLDFMFANSLDVERFELNSDMQASLINDMNKFYTDYIVARKTPKIQALDTAKRIFNGYVDNKSVIAKTATKNAIKCLKYWNDKKKDIDTKIELIKSHVVEVMNDAAYLTDGDGKTLATHKQGKKNRTLLIK